MNTYSGKSFSKVGFTHHAKYSYNSSFFLERYLKKVRTKYSFLRMWRLFSSGNWETFVIDFDIAAAVNVVGVKLGKIFGGARDHWKLLDEQKITAFGDDLIVFRNIYQHPLHHPHLLWASLTSFGAGFIGFENLLVFIVFNAVDLALLNA